MLNFNTFTCRVCGRHWAGMGEEVKVCDACVPAVLERVESWMRDFEAGVDNQYTDALIRIFGNDRPRQGTFEMIQRAMTSITGLNSTVFLERERQEFLGTRTQDTFLNGWDLLSSESFRAFSTGDVSLVDFENAEEIVEELFANITTVSSGPDGEINLGQEKANER